MKAAAASATPAVILSAVKARLFSTLRIKKAIILINSKMMAFFMPEDMCDLKGAVCFFDSEDDSSDVIAPTGVIGLVNE